MTKKSPDSDGYVPKTTQSQGLPSTVQGKNSVQVKGDKTTGRTFNPSMPNGIKKKDTIIYYAKHRDKESAWIQDFPDYMEKATPSDWEEWHIMSNPKGRVINPIKDSLEVYERTMQHAQANHDAQNRIGQTARNPSLPVLPTNYSFLFYVCGPPLRLVTIPQVIYPNECWVVYAKQEDLATFSPELTCDNALRNHVQALPNRVAAVKVAEYNPAVSFSYIWGNHMYTLKRYGILPPSNLPSKGDYIIGLDDAAAIVQEIQDDNSG